MMSWSDVCLKIFIQMYESTIFLSNESWFFLWILGIITWIFFLNRDCFLSCFLFTKEETCQKWYMVFWHSWLDFSSLLFTFVMIWKLIKGKRITTLYSFLLFDNDKGGEKLLAYTFLKEAKIANLNTAKRGKTC